MELVITTHIKHIYSLTLSHSNTHTNTRTHIFPLPLDASDSKRIYFVRQNIKLEMFTVPFAHAHATHTITHLYLLFDRHTVCVCSCARDVYGFNCCGLSVRIDVWPPVMHVLVFSSYLFAAWRLNCLRILSTEREKKIHKANPFAQIDWIFNGKRFNFRNRYFADPLKRV